MKTKKAILFGNLNGLKVKVHATTDHPDSSYGQEVWVDDNDVAYCIVGKEAPLFKVTEVEETEEPEKINYKDLTLSEKEDYFLNFDGLDIISTTSDANGYPKNIINAVIGFRSWEELKEFSTLFDLPVIVLHRKDGWNYWHREANEPWGPFLIEAEDFGDDCLSYAKGEDMYYIDSWFDSVCYADYDEADEYKQLFHDAMECRNTIYKLDDNQLAIIRNNRQVVDVVDRLTLCYSLDSNHYVIGLLLEEF